MSPQLNLFAVGTRSGTVRLVRSSGDEVDSLRVERTAPPPAEVSASVRAPVTALSWRPECNDGATSNMLLACDSQGSLSLVHATTGTVVRSASEGDNQILAAQYLRDGRRFLTAGTDETVRVYDDGSGRLEQELKYVGEGTVGHASRITCLHELESGVVVSGSWDSSLHFWDVRANGRPVSSIHGCFIGGGDAIDSYGTIIATATMSSRRCLQLWDVRSPGQLLTTYPTSSTGVTLYATRFMDNQRLVCAGSGTGQEAERGQGAGSLQVVDLASGRNLTEYSCAHKSPIFSLSVRAHADTQTQYVGVVSSRSAEYLSVI